MAVVSTSPSPVQVINLTGVTGNTTATIPAGYAIVDVFVQNTTANAITGGIKVGTTSGAIDVVVALAVGANAVTAVAQAALLLKVFSMSATQTLFIQTVTSWNSASVDIQLVLVKLK